jgi:heat shock protein beta
MDGMPDYLDDDDDGDRVPTADELDKNGRVLDTDKDGIPNRFDPDDDGDTIETADEYTPHRVRDDDDDGIPDHLDADDDGDGISTKVERQLSQKFGEDLDNDGLPNWLDADADGDGVPDSAEGLDDLDGDGVPDALTKGGIAGGACSVAVVGAGGGDSGPERLASLAWLGLCLLASRTRKRRRE